MKLGKGAWNIHASFLFTRAYKKISCPTRFINIWYGGNFRKQIVKTICLCYNDRTLESKNNFACKDNFACIRKEEKR